MSKSKLVLLESNDITEEIKRMNAFIKPNGSFYLAKGYPARNPSINLHQLESTALSIVREEVGHDIKKYECAEYFQTLGVRFKLWESTSESIENLVYLKSLLIHYYGYVLFARRMYSSEWDKGETYINDRFIDGSIIPDPTYYGKEATEEQVEVLKPLFSLNDDGSLLFRH